MPEKLTAPAHELSGVNTRGIFIFILCFIGSACVMFIVLWLVFGTLARHVHRHEPATSPIGASTPQRIDQPLQPSPGHPTLDWQDLAAMKAAQLKSLNAYAPIPNDPAHAKIPIDRAIQLLLQNKSLTLPPNPNAMPSTQPYLNTTQPAPTENRT